MARGKKSQNAWFMLKLKQLQHDLNCALEYKHLLYLILKCSQLQDEKTSCAVAWVVLVCHGKAESTMYLSIIPLILCFKIPDFSINLQFSSFWELLMSNIWWGWQHTQFTFSFDFFSVWAAGSSCLKVNHEGLFYCALADGKMATKSISSSLEVRRQTTKTV